MNLTRATMDSVAGTVSVVDRLETLMEEVYPGPERLVGRGSASGRRWRYELRSSLCVSLRSDHGAVD